LVGSIVYLILKGDDMNKSEKRLIEFLEIRFPKSEIKHFKSNAYTSDFFVDGEVIRVFHLTLNYIMWEVRLKKHGLNQYQQGEYFLYFTTRRYDAKGKLMNEHIEELYHYKHNYFRTAHKMAMKLKNKYRCRYVFEDMKKNDYKEYIQK